MSGRWILLLLMLGATTMPAQDPTPVFGRENLLKQRAVLIQMDAEDLRREKETTLPFPNIGREELYSDARLLSLIQQTEKEMAKIPQPELLLKELDRLLLSYVSQFGIRNFSENNSLIWKLARTRQLLGDTTRALFFYEMAQMHNYGTQVPVLAYDTLRAARESEWLPIDKYFEMLEVRQKIDPLIPPRKVLQPMGRRINTPDPEYAPYMHPSDQVLIYSSRRDTSGFQAGQYVDPYSSRNEDLYYTEVDFITGEWTFGRKLADSVNTASNEGSACLSPDGKTLYFTRCDAKRGFGDCDIYVAQYNDSTGGWGHVQNLGKAINSLAWDSQPHLSPDGRTLFFTSNRKGGFGGTDLYMSERNAAGRWQPAQNLGPLVNTPRDEVTPYFHEINQTLYFSSTGHMTQFGGYDIYKSRRLDDRWEMPRNIGPLVNTESNQYYFSINGLGTKIFYAHALDPDEDHEKQNFDLFSFDMPMEARPDAIAMLRGTLVDSVTGYTLQGAAMVIDLDEGVEVAPKRINENGYFEFALVNNRRYRLYLMGDNFFTIKNEWKMSGDTAFNIFTKSFEENKPLVFEALEFKSNSARLSITIKPQLDYVIRFLQAYPMFKLEVEGHTDADGKEENNLRLSKERAQAITDYINQKGGFTGGRVVARGYGETRPVAPNDTDENKRKNRRVEFKLVFDEDYQGERWLPTEEELFFNDSLEYVPDPAFDKDFEWEGPEREEWDREILEEDEEELKKELKADQLLNLRPAAPAPAKGDPKGKPAPKPAEDEDEELEEDDPRS